MDRPCFIVQKELLPLLERSSDGRIVTVSSMAHKMVKPRYENGMCYRIILCVLL